MDTNEIKDDVASGISDADLESLIGALAIRYGLPVPATVIILAAIGKLICNRRPPDTQVH